MNIDRNADRKGTEMNANNNTPQDYTVTLSFTVVGAYPDTIGRIANQAALSILREGIGSGVTYDYEEKKA